MNKLANLTMSALVAVTLSGCTGFGGDAAIYGDGGIADNGDLIGTLDARFIQQAGSSTVLPVAQAWADDFGGARGIQIKVAGGGSGAGGKGICQGELDIGDQSRPMKDSEFELRAEHGVDPVAWKVAFDGLSVVVSKDNTFVQDLSVEQLDLIFRKDDPATTWKDVDSRFPAEKIQACAPDAESGTYDYFNEEVLHEGDIRTDAERSADDNALVTCVAGSEYAVGFFGFAYVQQNEDKLTAVKVSGVPPTFETIADGSYTPLSRPIFMVTDGVPEPGSILYDYFAFAFHPEGGQALVPQVGYVSLDEGTRTAMLEQLGA